MNRLVDYRYAEVITTAVDLIPLPIADRLSHVHFFTGTNPTWAGLHPFVGDEDGDDRPYDEIAHCAYPEHQTGLPKSLRRTTIVLPNHDHRGIWTILHELGHALDEVLGFRYSPEPVTDYAARNKYEAFACAFEAWFSKGYDDYERLMCGDPATVALFERLAAGEAA